ncbi:MAG: folate-binding protein [Pseudomonadota bacterium]
MTNRRILRLTGRDNRDFLQGLVTNDVGKTDAGLVYAALLTPQGKFMADFFLFAEGPDVMLDVADSLGDMVAQRLTMYKLRAQVEIQPAAVYLHRGLGAAPSDGLADPRHPALGWRAFRDHAQTDDTTDWDALRVKHLIPETGVELTPDTYLLEAGFEALSGVDFRKGCYVGQEVTARMKHKTELRKGLTQVRVEGAAPVGTEITTSAGKSVGALFTQSGDTAIAYLRFDRAKGTLMAGDAVVTWPQAETTIA